tara:strand:+ start:154007 stop:154597 length:591 start_codon:yes stop_codon:yes gene_type:complete
MTTSATPALSKVLDQIDGLAEANSDVAVQDIIDCLGQHSFASTMLSFSLISASPASGVPGVTAFMALVIFILAMQMVIGRKHLWLPGFVVHRRISADKLGKGVQWLRKPTRFVERCLKERATFMVHRPWLFLPLFLVIALTMVMPFLEFVPMSGSIASAIIALFAAGLLTRDGALVSVTLVLMSLVPFALWWFGLR